MSLIDKIAPDFKLYNTEKKEVALSDHKGKNVLLLFFPLAFTGVCTTELCSVRDSIEKYNSMDAVVLGISVDSLFVLEKFKEENNLNFELLSDFNKEASKSYNCLYEDFVLGMKHVSKRSAFVLDKFGTVKYEEILENAGDMPDFEKIKSALADLN